MVKTVWKPDCKKIDRMLSRYLDNEVCANEKNAIEVHIKKCAHCASEKQELENLDAILRQIPDIIPAENSEKLFWEKINQTRKHRFVGKIRSLITHWEFIPVYYPAMASLLVGLVTGVAFSKVYNVIVNQDTLKPLAIEHLALNRMDPVPYSSFTDVHLSNVHLKHGKEHGER